MGNALQRGEIKMSKQKTVAVRLSEEQYDAFKTLAEKEQATVSFIVRRALREYLEEKYA